MNDFTIVHMMIAFLQPNKQIQMKLVILSFNLILCALFVARKSRASTPFSALIKIYR